MPKEKIFETTVQAPTKVNPVTGLLIGAIAICSVMMLGVFGANLAALATKTTTTNCIDSAESNNDAVISAIPAYSSLLNSFKISNLSQLKYFNVYIKSKATCAGAYYEDKCLIDVGNTSTPVPSCKAGDRNCRLQEGFIVNSPSMTPKVGNWVYKCPNGCRNGACIADPICVDSDRKSDGGDDIFMQGFITGMDNNGNFVSTTDYCVQSASTMDVRATSGPWVMEYGCGLNGRVQNGLISCTNGCIEGACNSYATEIKVGDVFKAANIQQEIYYYGADKKKHVFPNLAIYYTWYPNFEKLKVFRNDFVDSISMGGAVGVRPIGYIARIISGTTSSYYIILPNKTVQKFQSEKAVSTLYGQTWKSRVIAFSKVPYAITPGVITPTSKLPNGSLIKYSGSSSIYYIQNGKKRLFVGNSTFQMNGLYDSMVVSNVPITMTYASGPAIIGQESIFVKPY